MKITMKMFIVCCILFLFTCGCETVIAAEAGLVTDTVAAEMIVRDLGIRKVKSAHLLAFSAKVDDRPLYVECALVAVEFSNKRWRLVHTYRHPKSTKPEHRGWFQFSVADSAVIGAKDFKKPPTEVEVDQFLHETVWEFGASNGFRLLSGQVYSDTWQKALGYTPKHAYPKPSA